MVELQKKCRSSGSLIKTNVYLCYKNKIHTAMKTKKDLLLQLKDSTKQEEVFNSFLAKYRSTFDEAIGIKYSDKRYQVIDVKAIFYADFLEYVIEQLNSSDKTSLVSDGWVLSLADQRADDIRVKVIKSCAKHCLQSGGRENWDNFYEILRDELFAPIIGKIIKRYFDNKRYGGYYDYIKEELLTHLYLSRLEKHTPLKVEDFDSYLFGMFRSVAVNKKVRADIDLTLGLRSDAADVNIYGRTEAEEFDDQYDDTQEGDYQNEEDSYGGYNRVEEGTMNGEDEDEDNEDYDETNVENIVDDVSPNRKEWAEQEIERYLKLMPNKKRAEILRKIMLAKYDREELAAEMGCSRANVDVEKSRAMVDLYKVALPQIRQQCKRMVNIYKDELTDEYEKSILVDYFNSNKSLKELAEEYNKKQSDFTEDLIKAYDEVKSISDKTHKELKKRKVITESDIEKYEEEERKEEARSTLRRLNHIKECSIN